MKQMGIERTPYYAQLGGDVVGCKSVEEVIKKVGLDWEVEKQPLFLGSGKQVDRKFATVRKDNGQVLGIVGDNYQVVQNHEGFEFINECLGEGITFTKAGTYNRGERVFMVGEAPTVNICGDDVHPSILFTNSHDGSGTVKAMFTPMRVVCANGLMIPIPGHESGIVNIRVSHTRNVKDRLMIAQDLIMRNNVYIEALRHEAEQMVNTPFSAEQFELLSRELAGVKGEEGEKITRGQDAIITDLAAAYQEEDIAKFDGTAWKALMAVSDYDSHKLNSRNTGNTEYQFERVAYGMTVLVSAMAIIQRMTGVGFRR